MMGRKGIAKLLRNCDPRGDSLEGKSELLKAEDLGATAGRTEKQDVSIGVQVIMARYHS